MGLENKNCQSHVKKFLKRRQDFHIEGRPNKGMKMTVSDKDLALTAAGGDAEAFALVLDRHYDKMFGLAYKLTGRREMAEDIVQDVCLALPVKLGSYDGRAALGTWLYKVVMNAVHDARRKMQTHAKYAQGWGEWEKERQDKMSKDEEKSRWLQEAMGLLPEDLRDTVVLVVEGFKQSEIAQMLAISEGTVAWRINEVKKRLTVIKEEEGYV